MTVDSQRPEVVLFDLGGVVRQFDPDRRAARLAEAMGVTPGDVSALVFESGFDEECDLGTYSETEILERFRSFGFREDLHVLRRHWISAFEPVAGLIDLASELRADGVTVATFTDNGPVLLAVVDSLLPRRAFDQHVFSCMLGATKPDAEAFRAGLALLNASAPDVFFVDDKAQNINSARTLGIRAEQASTADEVESALRSVGLLDSVPRRTRSS
jgi:glucose-1-phosphatase